VTGNYASVGIAVTATQNLHSKHIQRSATRKGYNDCGSVGLFVENVAGHIKCYISVAWYATIHILMNAKNLRYQFPVIYDEIFETQ
jgi:hypothetical protein